MKVVHDVFLSLVRLGIGKSEQVLLSESVNWKEVGGLAERQGLSAIIVDSIDHMPETIRPPKTLLLQWIGEVLQGYEYRYESYCLKIAEMAKWYNEHGYKVMLLKGYACGLDWPKPEHRPYGDIDIWLFGKQKEADTDLIKEKGIKIDSSHHHHTVFDWNGFVVENHYDFIEQYSRSSSKELEAILKELGKDDTHYVELNEEKVYLPCPNLHALFLIRHMIAHFASVSITFRQVLDWAFFVEKHTKEIDWEWLTSAMKEYHMYDFFNCINAICVGDLGFDVKIFPSVQFVPDLKEKILEDIFNPEFVAEEPRCIFKRLIYKFKRWQGNAWKQKICFPESRATSFLTGLWAHILKPAHL